MGRVPRSVLSLLVVMTTTACSPPADGTTGATFNAPDADEWSSGLTIGFIPAGYVFAWNEGHETAIFHVFQAEEGPGQLSVGIQVSPGAQQEPGSRVSRGGHDFIVYGEGARTRATEDVGDGFRVDVLADSLDLETLLEIAESMTFTPDNAPRLTQP